MSKTDLHSSLLFLMIKLEEAKSNSMSDKNFVAALTDVLRYFRDNGELKKAYEIQKDSLTNMANSPWAKLVIGMFTSKVPEDKVDVELPDIDALIKENTSDEFIERKINDNFHFKYIVTKVTPNGKSVGIYQFSSDNIDFLKYYKVCSQSEWDSAIDRLNVWFKDASLKIKKL